MLENKATLLLYKIQTILFKYGATLLHDNKSLGTLRIRLDAIWPVYSNNKPETQYHLAKYALHWSTRNNTPIYQQPT